MKSLAAGAVISSIIVMAQSVVPTEAESLLTLVYIHTELPLLCEPLHTVTSIITAGVTHCVCCAVTVMCTLHPHTRHTGHPGISHMSWGTLTPVSRHCVYTRSILCTYSLHTLVNIFTWLPNSSSCKAFLTKTLVAAQSIPALSPGWTGILVSTLVDIPAPGERREALVSWLAGAEVATQSILTHSAGPTHSHATTTALIHISAGTTQPCIASITQAAVGPHSVVAAGMLSTHSPSNQTLVDILARIKRRDPLVA